MAISKTTRVENYRRIHVWTDTENQFTAEVFKQDWAWVCQINGRSDTLFSRYQGAVDWVMDQWRLAKAGLTSWDEPAAQMAVDDGREWESLTDMEQQTYLDEARRVARAATL